MVGGQQGVVSRDKKIRLYPSVVSMGARAPPARSTSGYTRVGRQLFTSRANDLRAGDFRLNRESGGKGYTRVRIYCAAAGLSYIRGSAVCFPAAVYKVPPKDLPRSISGLYEGGR